MAKVMHTAWARSATASCMGSARLVHLPRQQEEERASQLLVMRQLEGRAMVTPALFHQACKHTQHVLFRPCSTGDCDLPAHQDWVTATQVVLASSLQARAMMCPGSIMAQPLNGCKVRKEVSEGMECIT